jgi:hypothetical protein
MGTTARRACVVVLLGSLIGLVAYRKQYTSWPWQGEPFRIHYCGRTYDRFPSPEGTRTVVVDRRDLDRTGFRTPPVIGRDVVVPKGEHCGDGSVPTLLFRSVGGGRHREYVLLGGP